MDAKDLIIFKADKGPIKHELLTELWKKYHIPNPDSILKTQFGLDVGKTSCPDDLVKLFDQKILQNPNDGMVAALITYKNELFVLQGYYKDHVEEVAHLKSKLEKIVQRSNEVAAEYESRLETLNSNHVEATKQQQLDFLEKVDKINTSQRHQNEELEATIIKLKGKNEALRKELKSVEGAIKIQSHSLKETENELDESQQVIKELQSELECQRISKNSSLASAVNEDCIEALVESYESKIRELNEKIEELSQPVYTDQKSVAIVNEMSFAEEVSLVEKTTSEKSTDSGLDNYFNSTPIPVPRKKPAQCCGGCLNWKVYSEDIEGRLAWQIEQSRIYAHQLHKARMQIKSTDDEIYEMIDEQREVHRTTNRMIKMNEILEEKLAKSQLKQRKAEEKARFLSAQLQKVSLAALENGGNYVSCTL